MHQTKLTPSLVAEKWHDGKGEGGGGVANTDGDDHDIEDDGDDHDVEVDGDACQVAQ